MSRLSHDLKHLCLKNREGSFSTQSARQRTLDQAARQLREMGYTQLPVNKLKPKHVDKLVARWKSEKLSEGTIKNRMCHIRWWAEKTGRNSVVPSNENLGIGQRIFAGNDVDKTTHLDQSKLDQINNPHVRASLALQEAFGLRRAESIKIFPKEADRGSELRLRGSWCKGGRPRTLQIRTEHQRSVLEYAKSVARSGALIPSDKNYIQQLKVFENRTSSVGIDRVHGIRHAYALSRFQEIAGFPAPRAGGPTAAELTTDQKLADLDARLTISAELGHEREQITVSYLGR